MSLKSSSHFYKETKIGLIPKEWDVFLLDEFVTVKDGTHQTPTYTIKGVPFLRVTDIQNSKIDLTGIKYISEEEHQILTKRCKPQKGDILYSKNGTIGITKIVDWDWDFSIFVSLALLKIKDKSRVNAEFLKYYLSSWLAKREIYRGSKQGTVTNLHLEEIRKFRIPIPPLPEQRRIAAILGTWDKAIDLTERLITAKQQRKKALMQQLLTGKRRVGAFGWEYQRTNFDLPKDWRYKKMGNVVDVISSNVDKVIDPDETPVNLCNYMDVYKNYYITNDLKFMQGSANSSEISKYTLKKGDVIITKDSETPDDIANAAVVTEVLTNTVCGYHLAILRPDQQTIDSIFLMHLMHHPKTRYQFSSVANGVTRFGVTLGSIKQIEIPIPPLPEQRRIAAVLQICDREIDLLTQKLAALQQQKKGLMQKLLTGQVRVKLSLEKKDLEAA